MSRVRENEVWSIDDLELELRRLPGVRAAGFEQADDMLLVQLHVADRAEEIPRNDRTKQPVPVSATRIAARHADRPVAVEVVRWRNAPAPVVESAAEVTAPPAPQPESEPEASATAAVSTAAGASPAVSRARLLAVLAFPDTDELEVHLVLGGRRTIGRAEVSAGAEGAVQATLDAVRDLGTGVQTRVRWARAVEASDDPDREVVAVSLHGIDSRSPACYGLAAGTSIIDAAARATLDALNRHLDRER